MGVSGQVDHPGDRPVLVSDPRWPPDVLVDAQDLDAFEAGRVSQPAGGLGLDRVPAGVSVDAEAAGQG